MRALGLTTEQAIEALEWHFGLTKTRKLLAKNPILQNVVQGICVCDSLDYVEEYESWRAAIEHLWCCQEEQGKTDDNVECFPALFIITRKLSPLREKHLGHNLIQIMASAS